MRVTIMRKLFNALSTISTYYQAKVNYDMTQYAGM